MAGFSEHIDRFVTAFKKSGAIQSEAVERAFRRVERHRLVEDFYVWKVRFESGDYRTVSHDPNNPTEENLRTIYSIDPLITRLGKDRRPTSSTSMPGLVAQMLELLQLGEGHKILEIGAGTGYNAALMSEIVGSQDLVVTVDIQPEVVEQCRRLLASSGFGDIRVINADGFFGAPDHAPFDRLVATVACPDLSPHWVDQLANDGSMVIPLYQGGACPLMRVRKQNATVNAEVVGFSGFMPIQGEMRLEQEPRHLRLDGEFVEEPLWPDFESTKSSRFSFWYFLSAYDKRVALLDVPGTESKARSWLDFTFGLTDGRNRVVVGKDRIHLIGNPRLRDRLEEGFRQWDEWGRPSASDWKIEFVSKGAEVKTSDRELRIERQYFDQILRLTN